MPEPTRRQRRKKLTDKQVAELPRKAARYFHPDPEMPGHGVRVLPDGPAATTRFVGTASASSAGCALAVSPN